MDTIRTKSSTRSETLAATWKNRAAYKGHDRSKGSAYNSYRSIVYNAKGKDAGFPESWRDYSIFISEVIGVWEHGMIVVRDDTTLPHSASNSRWATKGTENIGKLVQFEYNGETKTLLEWSADLGVSYQGIRQRYFKGKSYTPHEVIYGKERKIRDKVDRDNDFRTLRMLGAYRLTDKKKGLECNISIEQMRSIILNGCTYCECEERIGLDRISNSLGHTLNNVVPCCYECNCARNDNFTHEEMKIIGKSIKIVRELRNENK